MPNQEGPKLKFCLYARKSSESEERQILSIESQIKEMREIAVREGLDVVETRSESHSAMKPGGRPEFNAMLDDIRGGRCNAVLTWAPDRLSRNAVDLGAIVDLMDRKLLLEIRTYNQQFADSPGEKFLLMIMGSQAKLENDSKGVNVSRGLRASVERGRWPGLAPLGYLNLYRTDKPGFLKVDPVRAPVIRQMFEKVARVGMSVRDAHAWMHDGAGFRTRGGKAWSMSGVYRALRNPFYYGSFEYPRKSGRWYRGAHEPIITKELYDAVQETLRKDSERSHRHHEFAFTRLITCGLCGSGISAVEKFKALKGGGTSRYVYYGCNRGRDRFCKARYIREEQLLEELVRIVDEVDVDDLGLRAQLDDEVRRFNAFMALTAATPGNAKPPATVDAKSYVKYVLREGSLSEKRAVLAHLRSRLIYRDHRLYLAK